MTINLTKAQAVVGIIMALLVPLLTGVGSYYRAIGDIDTKFAQLRLEREQTFVKKDEILRLEIKLDIIRQDLSEIKGFLKQRSR